MTERERNAVTLGDLDPTVRDLALRVEELIANCRQGIGARNYHLDCTVDKNGVKGAAVMAYEEFPSYGRKVRRA